MYSTINARPINIEEYCIGCSSLYYEAGRGMWISLEWHFLRNVIKSGQYLVLTLKTMECMFAKQ